MMLTASGVNVWHHTSIHSSIHPFIHSFFHSFIVTVDLLIIANETGLNITDIQEAILNITSITELLRPSKIL